MKITAQTKPGTQLIIASVPRSLQAVLEAEAEAEGVDVTSLILAKLATPLRVAADAIKPCAGCDQLEGDIGQIYDLVTNGKLSKPYRFADVKAEIEDSLNDRAIRMVGEQEQ